MSKVAVKMEGTQIQLAQVYAPELNESPTTTPFQTRASTPVLSNLVPETITKIHQRKSEKVAVGIADGSAIVPAAVKFKYLACYFLFNLGLTLFNKVVMNQFSYPYFMTTLHALTAWIGTSVLLWKGYFTLNQVGGSMIKLYGFSFLYTINIAISNVSLAMVTVPFHQIVRATTPVSTILIYREIYGCTYTKGIYLSLVPLIIGVGLATYGDYYATTEGFLYTLLGALLASAKTVATNRLQTAGLHLSALELLHRMSFLAFPQALAMSWLAGEFNLTLWNPSSGTHINVVQLKLGLNLAINSLMALGLNVTSFAANKKVGALTMTVAANVKQIMAVMLSMVFWDLKIGALNILGIALTLAGGILYARMSMLAGGRLPTLDIEKAGEK